MEPNLVLHIAWKCYDILTSHIFVKGGTYFFSYQKIVVIKIFLLLVNILSYILKTQIARNIRAEFQLKWTT